MKVKKLKDYDDWGLPSRTGIGIAITVIYTALLISLVVWRWAEIATLDANELGDFAAGAFGPIAILWLVLGYFQQGDELKQNTEALQLQARELANTVEQQRKLVELEREQFKADRLQRNKDAAARAAAVRPRFEFSLQEQAPIDGKYRPFDLTITNRGTPCSHLRATARGVSVGVIDDLPHRGSQTWVYKINYPSDKPLNEFDIYIGYVDSAGSPGLQTATITPYADEDISTLIVAGEDDIRVWLETVNHIGRQRLVRDE